MADETLYSPEEARKRFDSLPKEIRDMLYSTEMLTIVRNIGEKNNLHIDQVGLLQVEISSAMLGFTDTKDLSSALESSLNISPSQSNLIVKDIDEMLFAKIREAMKKVYEQNKTAVPITSPTSAPAPATGPTAPVSKLPPLTPRQPVAAPSMPVSTPPIMPPTASVAPVIPSKLPTPPAPAVNMASVAPRSTPVVPPAPVAPAAAGPVVPTKPVPPPPAMHAANVMLSEKTIEKAPAPQAYKKDPYREPVE